MNIAINRKTQPAIPSKKFPYHIIYYTITITAINPIDYANRPDFLWKIATINLRQLGSTFFYFCIAFIGRRPRSIAISSFIIFFFLGGGALLSQQNDGLFFFSPPHLLFILLARIQDKSA